MAIICVYIVACLSQSKVAPLQELACVCARHRHLSNVGKGMVAQQTGKLPYYMNHESAYCIRLISVHLNYDRTADVDGEPARWCTHTVVRVQFGVVRLSIEPRQRRARMRSRSRRASVLEHNGAALMSQW